ncbi:MAG: aminotransferase class III-fold pyridoxal phosphate-dependent enzyme, partial [Candidatus Methanoperedens sp.]|nr:aminotransferase class III-fold pyridoxal phosphate-dependent enzyme [Candidatus Methanoperedens sp.]
MGTEKSRKLFDQAKKILPGGVSSPVRAIKPYPFYTKRADGSKLIDIDGNEYIDYVMGYGPLLLGHNHPAIKEAVIKQLDDGWLYGTPTELEVSLANEIIKLYKSINMVRFVSTGTEATMGALRAARGFTGKN